MSFKLVTHKYVGLVNQSEETILDYWNASTREFLYKNNLFPDKLSNFYGRRLKGATFDYRPYSIIIGNIFDGTEMRLGQEYAKQINATLIIIDDEVNEWGWINDNWTGNGILGNVVEDKADLGWGALYTWFHEYNFLDLSLPLIRTGITCLTPAPRVLTSFLTPLLPFEIEVWCYVLVLTLILVTALKLITNIYDGISTHYNQIISNIFCTNALSNIQNISRPKMQKKYTFMESAILTMGMILVQPNALLVKSAGISCKLFLMWTFIFTVLITCSYSSGLSTILTVPRYEPSIKTVQDLAAFGMEWGATHDAWVFSIMEATQPLIVQVRNQFRTYNEQKLNRRSKTRDFAFSIERLPWGHFAIGSYITTEAVGGLQAMQQDIYWEYCVFMLKKNSPHLDKINMLIERVNAAGLMHFWEMDVSRKYMNSKVQAAVKMSLRPNHHKNEGGPVKLRTNHLTGLYALWGFGIGIACISFVLEIFHHKLEKRLY